MQFASAKSDLFMLAPSRSLSPRVFASLTRSLPARSTSDSFPRLIMHSSSFFMSLHLPTILSQTTISRTACDLDDVALISVASVLRLELPFSNKSETCEGELTTTSVAPTTTAPPRLGSSRNSNFGCETTLVPLFEKLFLDCLKSLPNTPRLDESEALTSNSSLTLLFEWDCCCCCCCCCCFVALPFNPLKKSKPLLLNFAA
mmetsp:Transcript_5603/g.16304  ORF Transcript_5603/g.16304 Transcript_5603/m.16304 type:complete len:202 (-) Transcript_5603:265-870(-)